MVPTHSFRRLAGAVLLVLGVVALFPLLAHAQDRSVPRFGPLVDSDTVVASPSDIGRIWSFAQPPLDYFGDEYGVRANERGLRHARLSTVRLPECSGTVVSPRGLVLTAARCVRPLLSDTSTAAAGASFYAQTLAQERSLPAGHAERVVAVEDVTAAVDSAAAAIDTPDGSRSSAGRAAVEQQRQARADAQQRVDVVREAGGARYVAYTYHRYDVRLAFLPDRAVGVLGRLGTPLTYPQHAWDVALLRLYEEGQPLRTPQHVEVAEQGARPGDPVFAVAHPPETQRTETHEQLAFRRDVTLPAERDVRASAAARLRHFVDTTQSESSAWHDRLAEAEVARRQTEARLEGLQNEYLMARLQSRDQQLRRASSADSALVAEGTGILDRLAALQEKKRTLASDYRAFAFLMHSAHASATLRRALQSYRQQEGDTVSAGMSGEVLQSTSSQPPALDAAALADHLQRLRAHLGPDSTTRRAFPDPASAPSLIRASVFSEEGQLPDDLPGDDPVGAIVASFYDQFVAFRQAWADLRAQERQLTDALAEARDRAAELPVTIPRDRSPRMADGRVYGYSYNGTLAPPFTTFYGLYERHHALQAAGQEEPLPHAWRTSPNTFDRATPLTTVASTDLGGGAYGGPLLNTSLELVGVVVDGNVQSAAGAYLFLPDRMRTVAVDARGVLEGLSAVYGADRLVRELAETPDSP